MTDTLQTNVAVTRAERPKPRQQQSAPLMWEDLRVSGDPLSILPEEMTMDTLKHPLPEVPPMNFNAIRDALKAHAVTLSDVYYADLREGRCDAT